MELNDTTWVLIGVPEALTKLAPDVHWSQTHVCCTCGERLYTNEEMRGILASADHHIHTVCFRCGLSLAEKHKDDVAIEWVEEIAEGMKGPLQ